MKYLTKGTIASLLGVAGFAAVISGHEALGRFLEDPTTVNYVLTTLAGLSSLLTLYAGAAKGIEAKA